MFRRLAKDAAHLLLVLLATIGRGLKRLGLITTEDNLSTLVLPPGATGNLGDDAMVSATLDYLRNSGAQRLGVIAFGNRAKWKEWLAEKEIVDLGPPRFLWMKLRFLFTVMRFRQFYCLGADMMDGYYFEEGPIRMAELASLASAAGVRTSILGFSFNGRPTSGSIRILANLPTDVRLCVRDPISFERLASYLDRPIELVADTAFVLNARADTKTASEVCRWIEEEREVTRVVVGVNFNHRLFLQSESAALDDVLEKFRSAIVTLFATRGDLSFLFIPHDYRPYGGSGDVEVAEALLRSLPEGIRRHSMVVGRCRAAEVRAICGRLDFVVAGLMHLAIGSLEQGTPVACLSYQGKFEGLMSHFDISGLIMDPEEALDDLPAFVVPLIENREETRKKVMGELPRIRRLAQANFR
jgi:polysaccharide pyruvyl transferase WcaK-like protein